MRRTVVTIFLASLSAWGVTPIGIASASPVGTGTTTRVSLVDDGRQAIDDSYLPAISADGRYVAFSSDAALSPEDVGWHTDVYVRDTQEERTELVSLSPAGEPMTRSSYLLGMSADGSLVFFGTLSTDYESLEVFLRDRDAGATRPLVEGVRSAEPSADGAWLTYTTLDPTGEVARVRLLDVSSGADTSVARASGGDYVTASVADTGDVVFATPRSLVPKDADREWDVYLWTRAAATFSLVSTRVDGARIAVALWPTLGSSGDAIAFFATGRAWPGVEIDVWERGEGVSHVTGVSYNEFVGFQADLSSEGRFVVFVDGEADEHGDTSLWLLDRSTGARERMDVNDFGTPSENDARPTMPGVSPDGRFVVFSDDSSQMVPSDSNGRYDVFVRDRAGTPVLTGAPDIRARASSEGWWAGGEGIDPQRDQGYTDLLLQRRGTGAYAIRLYNAGNAFDRFSFTGKGSNRWSRVRYETRGENVTAQVLDGTFQTRAIRPGGRQVLRMEVTAKPAADRCSSRTMYLQTRSATTPAWLDLVQVGITVSCARERSFGRTGADALPAWADVVGRLQGRSEGWPSPTSAF